MLQRALQLVIIGVSMWIVGCQPMHSDTFPAPAPAASPVSAGFPVAVRPIDTCQIVQETYWIVATTQTVSAKIVTVEGVDYSIVPYRLARYTYDSLGRIQSKYDSTWIKQNPSDRAVWTTSYRYTDDQVWTIDNLGWINSYALNSDGYMTKESLEKEFDGAGNVIKTTDYGDSSVLTTTYVYDPSRSNLPPMLTYQRTSKNLPVTFDFVMKDNWQYTLHRIGKYQYQYDPSGRVLSQLVWSKTLQNNTIFSQTDGVTLTEYNYKCR